MNDLPQKKDLRVWTQLVESHKQYNIDLRDFLSGDVDRVSIMRVALTGKERNTAIYIARHLSPSELKELFGELVYLASFAHGAIRSVRDLILSLPKEWILANIGRFVEPILKEGHEDEYRRILELYADLDTHLVEDLARRASKHADEDIREAGKDFLQSRI